MMRRIRSDKLLMGFCIILHCFMRIKIKDGIFTEFQAEQELIIPSWEPFHIRISIAMNKNIPAFLLIQKRDVKVIFSLNFVFFFFPCSKTTKNLHNFPSS